MSPYKQGRSPRRSKGDVLAVYQNIFIHTGIYILAISSWGTLFQKFKNREEFWGNNGEKKRKKVRKKGGKREEDREIGVKKRETILYFFFNIGLMTIKKSQQKTGKNFKNIKGGEQGWRAGKFFSGSGSWLFFQVAPAPAPDFFPERLRLLVFFFERLRLRLLTIGSLAKYSFPRKPVR